MARNMACSSDVRDVRSNEKEMIKAKLIFCLKCGDHFEIVEDLSAHVEANLNCKTKANLQFLSRQEGKQKVKKKMGRNPIEFWREEYYLDGKFLCPECGKKFSQLGNFQQHLERKDHTEIRKEIDKDSETHDMKSNIMEDNDFEPTNYLETNLVIKEEPIENDNNLVTLPKNEIKLEESGSGKDHRGIRRDIDAISYKNSEPNKTNHMKSIKIEDIDFEPTNYLETNLVIKEELIENDKSLSVLAHEGIKLEESGSEKEKIVAKTIFCSKCGDHFEKANDLYLHVEGNLKCETKE